jgi:uncharacterized protein YbjQ (UPF0145 family)
VTGFGGANDRAAAAIEAVRTREFLPVETDDSTDTTSGLTIDEQMAIAQVGFEAQDIVTGSAVARLGNFAKNTLHPFRNYEIPRLSQLLRNARLHAVTEMERQCAEIGGAGVIGVHLNLHGNEEDGLATFVASGTAVRSIGGQSIGGLESGQRSGQPAFTSSLSGQDFHLLLRNGCAPVGFVLGTSVSHFGWRTLPQWAAAQGQCRELVSLTTALYDARDAAIRQLSRQAADLGAAGVIDVTVLERSDVWSSHVIEFVAYGTAITVGDGTSPLVDPEVLVMLTDRETPPGRVQGHTFDRAGSHAE